MVNDQHQVVGIITRKDLAAALHHAEAAEHGAGEGKLFHSVKPENRVQNRGDVSLEVWDANPSQVPIQSKHSKQSKHIDEHEAGHPGPVM